MTVFPPEFLKGVLHISDGGRLGSGGNPGCKLLPPGMEPVGINAQFPADDLGGFGALHPVLDGLGFECRIKFPLDSLRHLYGRFHGSVSFVNHCPSILGNLTIVTAILMLTPGSGGQGFPGPCRIGHIWEAGYPPWGRDHGAARRGGMSPELIGWW